MYVSLLKIVPLLFLKVPYHNHAMAMSRKYYKQRSVSQTFSCTHKVSRKDVHHHAYGRTANGTTRIEISYAQCAAFAEASMSAWHQREPLAWCHQTDLAAVVTTCSSRHCRFCWCRLIAVVIFAAAAAPAVFCKAQGFRVCAHRVADTDRLICPDPCSTPAMSTPALSTLVISCGVVHSRVFSVENAGVDNTARDDKE